MAFVWAAYMPHPPIIVPEVGKGREKEAAVTLEGVARLLAALEKDGRRPDCVLLLSPHQPYRADHLFLNSAKRVCGSLQRFGVPQVAFDLETRQDFLSALAGHLRQSGLPAALGEARDLSSDQGSLVPLYYLNKLYPDLPPVILGSPIGLDLPGAFGLGKALKSFDDKRTWALLASGDLSHRLTPSAPAGYDPEGQVFDAAVVLAFETGDAGRLMTLPRKTLHGAGECGLRSALTLLGLAGGPLEVLSYEGPFGVGYCTALWTAEKTPEQKTGQTRNAAPDVASGAGPGAASDAGPGATSEAAPNPASNAGPDVVACVASGRTSGAAGPEDSPAVAARTRAYPALARATVARYLACGNTDGVSPPDVDSDTALWSGRQACFVSIKNLDGSLRGCIGTILPSHTNLGREIMANAVAAATGDPRFPPMRQAELAGVVFSVDVLSRPEPVTDFGLLDPRAWGVILTKGGRRGLLLPDLEGVDTVDKQLSIAAAKAGIDDLKGVKVERFSVTRYKEKR